IYEAGRNAVLQPENRVCRAESAAARDLLIRQNDERRIEPEQPFAAEPIGMVVEHSVAAADYGFRSNGVCETDARRKIVPVGRDERLILKRSILGGHKPVGGGEEIRPFEIALTRRGGELIAQPEVQGQLAADLPVVLNEQEVHMLIDIE